MRFTVLGSSAGGPTRTNAASGYLVQGAGSTVWMDAGPGTFMRLAQLVDPGTLDAVVVSHTHVDHCSDLLALFAFLAYGPSGAMPIDVFAPEGTRDHLAAFVRADADHVFHRALTFYEVVSGDQREIGGLVLRFGEAVHPVPAVVTRIDGESGSVVYSGDTGPGGDLIELATGAGTLLCEASLQGLRDADTYPHHLTAWEAGDVAATAGVDELVLTHIPFDLDPQLSIDQASAAFAGPVAYAGPGMTFDTRRMETR